MGVLVQPFLKQLEEVEMLQGLSRVETTQFTGRHGTRVHCRKRRWCSYAGLTAPDTAGAAVASPLQDERRG